MRALLLAGLFGAGLALTGCDTYDTVEYREGYGHYGHARTDVVIHDRDYDRGYYNRGYRGRDYRRVNVYDRDYDRRRDVNRVVVRDNNRSSVNRVEVRNNDYRNVNRTVVRNNDRNVRNVNRTVVRGNDRDRNVRQVSTRNYDRSQKVRRTNDNAKPRGDRDGRRGSSNNNRVSTRTVL